VSGATKREWATIGSMSLEWGIMDVSCRVWWYVMILVSHID